MVRAGTKVSVNAGRSGKGHLTQSGPEAKDLRNHAETSVGGVFSLGRGLVCEA